MERHPLHRHPLRTLFTRTGARSRRASSWHRSGGNLDFPEALRTLGSPAFYRVAGIGELFYAGRFDETITRLRAR